jgi:uncharacterized membrane protein
MNTFFQSFDRKFSNRGQPLLFGGLSLLFFGILILLVPNLLEVLIASFFITAGVFLLIFGWRMKKSISRVETWKIDF